MNEFRDWLIVNGASENTVKNYLCRIKYFLSYTNGEITQEKIQEFLLSLRDRYKPATINHFRNSIKSYITFAKLPIDIPKNLKLEKKIDDHISEEYFVNKIVPVAEAVFSNPLRVKAMLYFMFYTGIRRSDLNRLKRTDFDLEKRTAILQIQKTKQPLIVVYTDIVKDVLESYFNSEPEKSNAFNITSANCAQIFYRLRKYFPDIKLRPHLFRHSFATHLRKRGVRIEDIQEFMGHKSINSTMRYAHSDIEDRKKIYDDKVNGDKINEMP